MLRIFIIVSLISAAFSLSAQQTVFSQFDAIIWADEFDATGSSLWRQTTNADEIFIIQEGEYILYRTNEKTPGLVFPNEKMNFSAHKAEFKLKLDDENDKEASGGAIVMAQDDGQGAFLVEINGKKQYRISKYNGSVFKPIGEGWKKHKAIAGRGEDNIITVAMENKMYDVYINGELITSFSEVSYKSGKIGLYAGPASKVRMDYVHIYVTANEKERLRKELQQKRNEEENPALTDIIKRLREQVLTLEQERDSLRVIVKELEKKGGGNTGGTPSVQKLKTENKELKDEIERLKRENAAITKENDMLRRFKETIEGNQDGDMIISLTNAIETERQRVEVLVEENEKLTDEIKRLKEKLKN